MLNHVEGSSLQSHANLSCCYKLVANHPTAQRPSGMETTKCIPIETNAIGGDVFNLGVKSGCPNRVLIYKCSTIY